ncbi:MAG: hypothetical protein KDJ70_11765 [Candidatus Competibacteraceae bacterium]|nr:hypothetical protein [Candidatus Competibacteraceae bacterium]
MSQARNELKIDDIEPSVRVGFDLPAHIHTKLRMAAFRERTSLRALIVAKLAEAAELERIRGIS